MNNQNNKKKINDHSVWAGIELAVLFGFFYLVNQEKNQKSVDKFLERLLFYHNQYLISEMDFAIVEKWRNLATEY